MAVPVRPLLLPGPPDSRPAAWRRWLLGTFPGRALLIGVAIKATTRLVAAVAGGLPGPLEGLDVVGSLALLFAVAYGVTRLAFWARRRLLWRVRRKLILSYVFVGVVPVLLVITFFLLAGLLLFFNVSSYWSSRASARSPTSAVPRPDHRRRAAAQPVVRAVAEALERRQAGIETRYPFVSLTVVPVSGRTPSSRRGPCARRTLPVTLPATVGPGRTSIRRRRCRRGSPVTVRRIARLQRAADRRGSGAAHQARHARRGAARPARTDLGGRPRPAAVPRRRGRITEETGIRIGEVTALPFGSRDNVLPVAGARWRRWRPTRSAASRPSRSPPSAGWRFSTTSTGRVAPPRARRWRCASTPGRSTTGCRRPRPASAR